jgi:hypothetical protein
MFARLRAAVGEAAHVAAREMLSVEECIAIRLWLEPLEAMVRKILLIEAIRLARQPHAPPAREPALCAALQTPRAPARLPFRFSSRRLLPPAPRAGNGPAHVAPQRRTAIRPSIEERFAGRIEALARIIASPQAHTRRLARALRVAPNLALKLASRPPAPTQRYDNAEIQLASITAVDEARALPANTS